MNRVNTPNINYIINKKFQESSVQSKKINSERKAGFEELLDDLKFKNMEIKFSKHAIDRMGTRNIQLKDMEIRKIEDAIQKASDKGVREALILMDNVAFIANIRSKTIITTATSEQLRENVFTNIDGAVII